MPVSRTTTTPLKARVPWRLKLGVKLAIARLPVQHDLWHRVGVFQHGFMDDPAYAVTVFDRHMKLLRPEPGFTLLELGPGDSLATALLAKAYGASRSILVDVAPFFTRDLRVYRQLAEMLADRGHEVPSLRGAESVEDMLSACDATFLTNGLASLRELQAASVDHAFSHAVVEHIPLAEFEPTFRELHRLLRRSGSASHSVDLQDHLSGGLNHLRFRSSVWESRLFRPSGFYTNRLRYSQLLSTWSRCGFTVKVPWIECWDQLPIRRESLARPFQDLAEADLNAKLFDCVLRPVELQTSY